MVAFTGDGWRVPPSIRALFNQADAKAPNRSIASDGTIGDANHQAGVSDHNPDRSGDVLAGDVTHDPANGLNADTLAETIRVRRDPRVKYVIRGRRMFSSYATGKTPAWTWRTYTGINPHLTHVHVSVLDDPFAKSDTSPWFAAAPPPPTPPPEVEEMASGIALANQNGNVVMAGNGTDGHLWLKVGNGGWVAFNGQGGRPDTALLPDSAPGVTVVNDLIVLGMLGADAKSYRITQNANGTWTGPVGTGGVFQ